jgi:hypothetical protein
VAASLLVVMVIGVVTDRGAPAAAASQLGPTVDVRSPPNASAVSHSALSGVACSGARSCVAVGSYEDTSRAGLPMIATKTASGWTRAIALTLPVDHADAYSASGLAAVTCTSPGNCAAVGSYEDASRSLLPMLALESAGAWGAGATFALPTNAGANELGYLTSVSCVAVATCTAVGAFTDSQGSPELLAASTAAGKGKATEVTLPKGAGIAPRALGSVELTGVSCSDASDCVAVGSYLDGAGAYVPLRVGETKGVWRAAVRVALPRGSPAIGSAALEAVSCTSVGDCVAVGHDTDAAGNTEPIVERDSGGEWAPAVPIGLPLTRPSTIAASLSSVVCATRSCVVVGELTASDGTSTPAVLINDKGRWEPLQRLGARSPTDPRPTSSGLSAVACPAPDACVAVGDRRALSAQGAVTSSTGVATTIVPVRPIVDPAPPSSVAARPGPGELHVAWAPGADGGSAITSYSAMASPGGASCTSSRPACTISGLHDGTRYTVVVTATNVHGTSLASAPSPSVVPGVVPTAPSGLVVTPHHGDAVARWEASVGSPGDPVTQYVVTAVTSGAPPHRCSTTATACALEGLTRGDNYTVWVIAYNAVGPSARSASKRFTSG